MDAHANARPAVATLALLLCAACGASSGPASVPLTVLVGPVPARVSGGTMLVYEVLVGSDPAQGLTMSRVDVRRDGPAGELLKRYQGPDLAGIAIPAREGQAYLACLLIGLTIPDGAVVPTALHHEVTFADGTATQGGVATVSTDAPLQIAAPVRGDRWYVGNGPTVEPVYHRNGMQEAGGRFYGPERFAVDWVRLGTDGRAYQGEGLTPAEWVCHGADVVAVADGTILDARDGLPDNSPVGSYLLPMTMQNVQGNYVVLDIRGEHTHFALYAHFAPGSLQVRAGDRVTAGQVIGKLGSSGNSGAPHLHFHVCDGRGPFADRGDVVLCNGLPYVLSSFTLLGSTSFEAVDQGVPWTPTAPPQVRSGELVLDGQVVDLGP
jgi:murein DD-endopeptidase